MKPFSIVIPTFNNKSYKQACLPKLLDVMGKSADVIEDVVIVDNGSTDGGFTTTDFADIGLPIRLEQFPKRNRRAAARNYGVELSKAPYLVFIDDDMLIPGALLADLADEIHENAFWSCAKRLYLPLHTDVNSAANAMRNLDRDWLNANAKTTPGGAEFSPQDTNQMLFTHVACFGIIPRKVFSRVGGFSEQFVGWGCEDVELVSRLLAEVPLVNLFKRYVTFHLDHVVSPYTSIERKNSRAVFWDTLKARNQLFNPYGFGFAVAKGDDIAKRFEPYSKSSSSSDES